MAGQLAEKDLFIRAGGLLVKSGAVGILTSECKRSGLQVQPAVPCSRRGVVTGAAVSARGLGGGADYYEGSQVLVIAEPDLGEISIRSRGPPVRIETPKRGDGGWTARRKQMTEAVREAIKNPAEVFWCEGMAGEESNYR